MSTERTLRIVTLFTSALATPLSIGLTVASLAKRPYHWHRYYMATTSPTAFCFLFIPLAMTAFTSAVGLLHHRKHGRMPDFRYALLDLLAFIMYIGILLPCWIVGVGRLVKPGLGLLAGYTTAPMIINMFVHFYILVSSGTFITLWLFKQKEQECPNCRSKFVPAAPQTQQIAAKGGEGYSLLRGEEYLDGDACEYTDMRTSEDELRVAGGGEEVETGKGKGAIKI